MIFFFDLDGTLRRPKIGAFINEPKNQEPIPGAEKALKYYSNRGFICIGITNQGGVAAGYKSIEQTIEEQQITLSLFPELEQIYFCPDFKGNECWVVEKNNTYQNSHFRLKGTFRKPGSGMLIKALKTFNAEAKNAWIIGDRPEDFECAKSIRIKFIWADFMLDKFNPGIYERTVLGIDRETLMEFLAI